MAQGMKFLEGYESYISLTQDPVNDCLAFAQLAGDRYKIWFSGFSRDVICPRIQSNEINIVFFEENTEYTTQKLWEYLRDLVIKHERVCIMFDDPSPLLITHTFENFSINLKNLSDLISEHDSLLLVCIDKQKFHRRQVAFLKTFLQPIKLHRTAFFPPGSKCVCPICGTIIDCHAKKCEGCGVTIIEDAEAVMRGESDELVIVRSQLRLYGSE